MSRSDKEHRYAVIEVDGVQTEIDYKDIKKGMIFYLFEPDGKPVRANIDECYQFIAKEDAYLNSIGKWEVLIDC